MRMKILVVICLNLLPLTLSAEQLDLQTGGNSTVVKGVRPSQAEVWGYGVLMVTVISLASVVGVAVIPVMSKPFYSRIMTGLIGLAVGSLAASSVFHLIPGAFRQLPPISTRHCHYNRARGSNKVIRGGL